MHRALMSKGAKEAAMLRVANKREKETTKKTSNSQIENQFFTGPLLSIGKYVLVGCHPKTSVATRCEKCSLIAYLIIKLSCY